MCGCLYVGHQWECGVLLPSPIISSKACADDLGASKCSTAIHGCVAFLQFVEIFTIWNDYKCPFIVHACRLIAEWIFLDFYDKVQGRWHNFESHKRSTQHVCKCANPSLSIQWREALKAWAQDRNSRSQDTHRVKEKHMIWCQLFSLPEGQERKQRDRESERTWRPNKIHKEENKLN